MVRFKEVPGTGEPPVVGTLYVSKWAAEGLGQDLTVTIDSNGSLVSVGGESGS